MRFVTASGREKSGLLLGLGLETNFFSFPHKTTSGNNQSREISIN